MSDDQQSLLQFTGAARLFPLPNLVLFPQVVVPLHIFEPRYRELTADALETDRLISVVLLRPGWESDYEGKPAIHPVGCLGRIIAEQKRPDGRYDILLRGLSRVRFGVETATDHLYRVAQAQLLQDGPLPTVETAVALRHELAERVLPRFVNSPAQAQLRELFDGDLPLGPLCDVLSFALPVPTVEKQVLLEMLDVARRAQHLIQQVDEMAPFAVSASDRKFPPDFSSN